MAVASQRARDLQEVFCGSRDRAVEHKKKIVEKGRWKECRDAYHGEQWAQTKKDLPGWKSSLVSAEMFGAVERLVPVLTDQKPKPAVSPEGQEDNSVSAYLMRALDREFEAQNVDTVLPPVLRDVLTLGTGFLHTGVEPGIGKDDDLYTRRVSPWNVYVTPGATSDRRPNATWVHNRMSAAEIWCYYPPDIAKAITDESPNASNLRVENEADYLGAGNSSDVDPTFYNSGTSTQTAAGTGSFESSSTDGPGSIGIDGEQKWDFWEGYLEDPQTQWVNVDDQDENGQPLTRRVQVPVYPHGRFVCLIGDTYLPKLDRPNPFPHRMSPLIPIRCYDIGNYFGLSFIMRALDTDEAINRIDNQILNCIALTLNPVIVVDDDSNIDFDNFAPFPGVVIKKRRDSKIEFVPPPPLPQYVFSQRSTLKRALDDTLGISDISKGNFSGQLDDVSGTAVQRLQEPTYTRVRAILRNMEKGLTFWMRQTVANMIVFRDDSYWQRLLGPYLDPTTGAPGPYPWTQWNESDLAKLPDVKMSVGSSLPSDKQARINNAINFYDRQVYGPVGSPTAVDQVLKAADDPDREKIVREAEAHFAMAQAQMLAQQGQPTPNGGAPPGLNKATGSGASPAETQGIPEPQGAAA